MSFKLEKAILVNIEFSSQNQVPSEESLEELERLTDTYGAQVLAKLSQKRPRPDLRYFIGPGKLEELKALKAAHNANLVIFDNELLPSQNRNLEEYLELRVMDRTALILDIFGKHAKSREGKVQVELAQLEYELPRLAGKWTHLHRQRGGIGLREVGEKQIELDKRMIRRKISLLKKDIEKLKRDRHFRREKRKKSHFPLVAIVGYTNSGKSTLLNLLTNAGILTKDKLFATLDPTTRKLNLGMGKAVLLTDTVGFIQKLPHQLVAAFAATLEEVTEADFLLHVVDASHPYFEDQIDAVYNVLEELKCIKKPIITVFNKIDKLGGNINKEILKKYKPAVGISALKNEGITDLVQQLLQQPLVASLTY